MILFPNNSSSEEKGITYTGMTPLSRFCNLTRTRIYSLTVSMAPFLLPLFSLVPFVHILHHEKMHQRAEEQ